jgi:hypothetical protein
MVAGVGTEPFVGVVGTITPPPDGTDGALGVVTGIVTMGDGGRTVGVDGDVGRSLQHSRKIPSAVGQQSPVKPTQPGLNSHFWGAQQSRKTLSVVGQQSPVKPKSAHAKLATHSDAPPLVGDVSEGGQRITGARLGSYTGGDGGEGCFGDDGFCGLEGMDRLNERLP